LHELFCTKLEPDKTIVKFSPVLGSAALS